MPDTIRNPPGMVIPMIRRIALAALAAVLVPACGMPTVRPLTGVAAAPAPVVAAGSQVQGAYLSVDLRPNLPLFRLARDLRMQLGFIDMGQAQPPRSPEAFHITVGYFHQLSRNSLEKLSQHFKGHTAEVKIPGWGVAQNQAAYFVVTGINPYREQIHKLVPENFSSDDPHVTFGVHPNKPKDVHGVPKPQLTAIPPMRLVGDLHLHQGDAVLW